MQRQCFIYKSSDDGRRHICIDLQNAELILQYIKMDEKYKKKFKQITEIILRRFRVPELYDKENINNNCKGVTAMKFFKTGENSRIYCKEFTNEKGIFYVVAAEILHKKKDEGNKKKTKNLIEKVSNYDYEIIPGNLSSQE